MAGGVLLVISGCAAWRIGQSVELVKRSEPLQHTPNDAKPSLLIVGDSTAVGTGATSGKSSLAGLIAQQRHIADGLGLSLVHTNKTLRKLERRGLHRIADGRLYLRDVNAMARLADLYGDGRPPARPLV